MSKLESLKVRECPYAFADLAAKHNALVDMLSAMQGQNGITVVIAERNAIIRGNVNANGGGAISGNVTPVVTSDGSLANAYYANNDANAFPTTLKTVNPAGNVVLDNLGATAFKARILTASGNVTIDSVGLSVLTSGGKYCNIAFANIARDVGLRTISICSNGNTKSMDILASAPY